MNGSEPGKDAGHIKTTSATNGAAAGWTFTVRCGTPSAEADDRWARRVDMLAAWLVEEYERLRREHPCASAASSAPTSLDPSEHRATPVSGTLEAEGERTS